MTERMIYQGNDEYKARAELEAISSELKDALAQFVDGPHSIFHDVTIKRLPLGQTWGFDSSGKPYPADIYILTHSLGQTCAAEMDLKLMEHICCQQGVDEAVKWVQIELLAFCESLTEESFSNARH